MNKSVLDKLSKFEKNVELAEVKVDLALVDDVKKAYKDAIDARKKSFDEMQVVQKAVMDGLKKQQELAKINENSIPVFERFEAAAKSLGVDIPKEILDQKKNIQDGLKGTFAKYVKTLQSFKAF
jgi:hypothetical protein